MTRRTFPETSPKISFQRASLSLDLAVDPKDLAVNKRYRDNGALPPEVVSAMGAIGHQVNAHLIDLEHIRRPFVWDRKQYYGIDLVYTMVDRRTDADGPTKHVIDAIFRAAKMAEQKANDSRLDVINVRRVKGEDVGAFFRLYPIIGDYVHGDDEDPDQSER